MNILSFEELFDTTAFPVSTTNVDGEIIYKNPATQRYIPMLRKGASLKRYLASHALPKEEFLIRLNGDTPYRYAISVRDENGFLFLAFPRLQYEDREKIAQNILALLGDSLTVFLDSCREFLGNPTNPSRAFSRLYAELPRLYRFDMAFFSKSHSCANIFTETTLSYIERLSATLGFRVRTSISPDFNPGYTVSINPLDLTFLFGQLLYCVLRMSVSGTLDILLTSHSEYRTHTLRFKVPAHTIPSDEPSYLILCRAAPECTADILLMEKAGILSKWITIFCDETDRLTVDFAVPYQTATVNVSSLNQQDICATLFDCLFTQITELLTETLSSC